MMFLQHRCQERQLCICQFLVVGGLCCNKTANDTGSVLVQLQMLLKSPICTWLAVATSYNGASAPVHRLLVSLYKSCWSASQARLRDYSSAPTPEFRACNLHGVFDSQLEAIY